jgi:hypothetical protein
LNPKYGITTSSLKTSVPATNNRNPTSYKG